MLKDNQSIRATKASLKPVSSVLTVVILFLIMQVPGLIVGLVVLPYFFLKLGAGSIDAARLQMAFVSDNVLLFNLYFTILVSIAAYLFARYYQKRNNTSLGLTNPNRLKNYFKGLCFGYALFMVCLIILRAFGLVEITNNLASVSGPYLILFVIGWILQGFEEELVCRSIIMNFFAAKNDVMVGILANSVIFTILHIGNAGYSLIPFINIYLMGIIFSIIFYIADDIFISAAAHSMWNFAQANIFGMRVSGEFLIENTAMKSSFFGSPLLTGGDFGIEGGLVVTLVFFVVVVLLSRTLSEKYKLDEQ